MDTTTKAERLKEEAEAKRKAEELFLSSEPRKLWSSYQELEESLNSSLQVRSPEFAGGQRLDMTVAETAEESSSFSVSRRGFLQWMGAAGALMTGSACKRREKDFLVPYVHKPQGYVMGVPVWYASVTPQGYGVLVKTREGKPIKLEGNANHPLNKGGLDAEAQAELLELFNPERLKSPKSGGAATTWQALEGDLTALRNLPAASLRLLTGPIYGPSTMAAIGEFLGATKAKHHVLLPHGDLAQAAATKTAFSDSSYSWPAFDKAEVIVSVDSDFLGSDDLAAAHTKAFSRRRKIHRGSKEVNRLFVFESMMTVTGIAADHRVAIAPSMQLGLLKAIAAAVAKRIGVASDAVAESSLGDVAQSYGLKEELLNEVVSELVSKRGKSLVVAGGFGPQARELRLAAFYLNSILGNIGTTLLPSAVISGAEGAASFGDLVSDIEANKVDVLIINGVNPAYSMPGFTELLKTVKKVIVLTREENETSRLAHIVLPESHFLEAWGDSQRMKGQLAVQQPVIEPLYASKSLLETVLMVAGKTQTGLDFVQSQWKKNYSSGANFDLWWASVLKAGFLSQDRRGAATYQAAAVSADLKKAKSLPYDAKKIELVVYRSPQLKEGERASNAWLQELPDPVSKVTWNNFVALSPDLAKTLSLREDLRLGHHANDIVSLKSDMGSLELAAHIQPGLRSNVVAVAMGYGRTASGSIASGLGKNILNLSGASLYVRDLRVSKTGASYALATTQRHFELHGRDQDILQQATLKDFLNASHGSDHGEAAHDESKHFSLYDEKEFVYPGHKWGMAIDLNSCTGCNACVVSCYNENNIGVVGEAEVFKGRHMAWMRLDLYYGGSAEEPEAAFQPMLCQQCDKAPCETVCPVLATVHSSDGLNDMSYNRCVGTRYCANNCPYKVRRFNYFQYTDKLGGKVDFSDPLPLLLNPDVTVRTRGVMEKCTFCVQRIRRAVDEEKDAKKPMADGTILTACQQSCPADAIVFGDLNNPESEVAKLSKAQGKFKVLEVLNTRPSVTYLPRVRNKGLV